MVWRWYRHENKKTGLPLANYSQDRKEITTNKLISDRGLKKRKVICKEPNQKKVIFTP